MVIAFISATLIVVASAIILGPRLLDDVRTTDKVAPRRTNQSSLEIAHRIERGFSQSPSLYLIGEAGAESGAPLVMAAYEESRGEPTAARIWMSLDAESRGLKSMANARVIEVTGHPIDSSTLGELRGLFDNYAAWYDWSHFPKTRTDLIGAWVDEYEAILR